MTKGVDGACLLASDPVLAVKLPLFPLLLIDMEKLEVLLWILTEDEYSGMSLPIPFVFVESSSSSNNCTSLTGSSSSIFFENCDPLISDILIYWFLSGLAVINVEQELGEKCTF